MRVAYVTVREGAFSETSGPQPRIDAETWWDGVLEDLESRGGVLTRLHLEREGDTLRRAEFDGPRGPIEVLLIDDGSW